MNLRFADRERSEGAACQHANEVTFVIRRTANVIDWPNAAGRLVSDRLHQLSSERLISRPLFGGINPHRLRRYGANGKT